MKKIGLLGVIGFVLCCLSARNVQAQVNASTSDPAQNFLQNYARMTGLQANTPESLRSLFLSTQNERIYTQASPSLKMQALNLPSFKDLAYTTYDVFPQNMASVHSWCGLTTRSLPVNGNVWVMNDQKYNTPGYMFIRGMLQPGGIGTAMIQNSLGGMPLGRGYFFW